MCQKHQLLLHTHYIYLYIHTHTHICVCINTSICIDLIISSGSIKKTDSENLFFSPSALSKRFSLHLRTFSKTPTERGIRDCCFCVQSSQDFSRGEECSCSQISALWQAFPIGNMEDKEEASKSVELKVANHRISRLYFASRPWVGKKRKKVNSFYFLSQAGEVLCLGHLLQTGIKDFKLLLQNKMSATTPAFSHFAVWRGKYFGS